MLLHRVADQCSAQKLTSRVLVKEEEEEKTKSCRAKAFLEAVDKVIRGLICWKQKNNRQNIQKGHQFSPWIGSIVDASSIFPQNLLKICNSFVLKAVLLFLQPLHFTAACCSFATELMQLMPNWMPFQQMQFFGETCSFLYQPLMDGWPMQLKPLLHM